MERKSKEERKKRMQEKMKNFVNGGSNGKFAMDYSDYKDVPAYKPKENYNTIDIVTYIIKDGNKHPEGPGAVGFDDWKLVYGIHYKMGPDSKGSVVCLKKTYGKPCPVCEEQARLKENGAKKEDVDALNASVRVMYNVLDENGKINLFSTSWALFHRELKEKLQVISAEKGVIPIADLDIGMSVKFRGSKKFFSSPTGSGEYLEFKDFEFLERDPIDESILDQAVPLETILCPLTYEQIDNILFGKEEIMEEEPVREQETDPVKEEVKEVVKEEVSTEERTRRPRRAPKEETPVCPSGLEFGKDCDSKKECEGCPDETYDKCYAKYESLQ